MAFFGDQTNRLLQNWDMPVPVSENPVTGEPEVSPSATNRAMQELATLIGSPTTPMSTSGPVTINQSPGLGGLTINGNNQPQTFGDTTFPALPSLTINGGNIDIGGTTINIGGGGGGDQPPTIINIGGGTTINFPGGPPINIAPLPPITSQPPDTAPPPSQTTPPSPGAAYMGTVTGGSGKTYTMNCIGLGEVEVTVPQIDPNETVPVGTSGVVVSVFKRDSTGFVVGADFYFQPPVWLQ